jgi:hypothetical protein
MIWPQRLHTLQCWNWDFTSVSLGGVFIGNQKCLNLLSHHFKPEMSLCKIFFMWSVGVCVCELSLKNWPCLHYCMCAKVHCKYTMALCSTIRCDWFCECTLWYKLQLYLFYYLERTRSYLTSFATENKHTHNTHTFTQEAKKVLHFLFTLIIYYKNETSHVY